MSYDGDSFFTLSTAGQIGLAALSVALFAGALAVVWRWPRIWMALLVFWLFLWLSPQVYYLYYQMIFDDLPWQIVVKTPPGPGKIAQLLFFFDRPTLSAHSKGVLGWALIAMAVVRESRRWRDARWGRK
jgi:vacuolar-type H+-ATPase subunit I/STV1